ncbi:MAG: DNA/RNA nuclease SfsA [Planctomycetota bacterium]
MHWSQELVEGRLIRRYKRFLADIQFDNETVVTAHCPNPGAMTGLAETGSAVLVTKSGDSKRKLAYTWELVKVGRIWAIVNTQIANRVVADWLRRGLVLPGHTAIRSEFRRGDSRFDFLLDDHCLVEVKSVTLAAGPGEGAFPDSVTVRGTRHVEGLAQAAADGMRAVLLFFVARGDLSSVRPADEIDPTYAAALRDAARRGVEVMAVRARATRRGIAFDGVVPVNL